MAEKELWGFYSTLVSNEPDNEHDGWLLIGVGSVERLEKRLDICKRNAGRLNAKYEIR